jgi:hypothetical protein
MVFHVNKLQKPFAHDYDMFGGGAVTWTPERHLKFSVAYGDQLIEGSRGLLFSTKLDLGY